MSDYPKFPGFVAGCDTSQAAAESIEKDAPRLQREILKLIDTYDTATCDEIEEMTNIRHQSCSARFRELVLAGRIIDTGLRRKTRSGRSARVYRAV